MVNKRKQKGTTWERDFVNLLTDNIDKSKVKRLPSSGAMGTALGEPMLSSDVVAEFPGFQKKFRFECKTGYGGDKQLTVQKEWLNKIIQEAKDSYSIPAVACKFSGSRKSEGVQYFLLLDFNTFCDIINYIGEIKEELDLSYGNSMGLH